MSERVSSQVVDSVTQTESLLLGDAPGFALGQGFLSGSQGSAVLYANMVAEQQQHMLAGQAAAGAAVRRLFGERGSRPRSRAPEPDRPDADGGPADDAIRPEAGPPAPETLPVAPPAPKRDVDLRLGGGPRGGGPDDDDALDEEELDAVLPRQGADAVPTPTPPEAPGGAGPGAGPSGAAPGGGTAEAEATAAALARINEQICRLLDTVDRLTETLARLVDRSPAVT